MAAGEAARQLTTTSRRTRDARAGMWAPRRPDQVRRMHHPRLWHASRRVASWQSRRVILLLLLLLESKPLQIYSDFIPVVCFQHGN